MLEKKVIITNHFIRKFQRRARNHCHKPTHKNIRTKLKNILEKLENSSLIKINGNYFAKVMLSRECQRPFYMLLADNADYLSLVTIYTEDMFLKRYNNKINH